MHAAANGVPSAVANAAAGVTVAAAVATANPVKTGVTGLTVGRVAKAGPKPAPRCAVKPDRKAVPRVALTTAAKAEATVRHVMSAVASVRPTPTAARWAKSRPRRPRAAHRGPSVNPGRWTRSRPQPQRCPPILAVLSSCKPDQAQRRRAWTLPAKNSAAAAAAVVAGAIARTTGPMLALKLAPADKPTRLPRTPKRWRPALAMWRHWAPRQTPLAPKPATVMVAVDGVVAVTGRAGMRHLPQRKPTQKAPAP